MLERGFILMGDFNLLEINWEAGTGRGRAEPFREATEDALMEQLLTFPTKIRGNILDLVLTTIPERKTGVMEAGRLGGSDYTMNISKVQLGNAPVEEKEPLPNWRKADWEEMRRELAGSYLISDMAGVTVEEAWIVLKD
jgi:hypothetical protein